MQVKSSSGRMTRSVLIGSTAMMVGMALTGMGSVAYAQGAPAAAPSTEVVVTGSRIAKKDFASTSPMVTVNSAQFENTANIAIEATLNKLPQFTPAQDLTGVNSSDVQPTATNTIGISTASLRGLGPNRNLVLADGQRLQPVNGALVVDLNSIPAAIIDRVEVVTGGASAVYGADAISGVVNFILKKNFQGVDLDLQYGVTQVGDGNEFKASALFGTNFADDRGNVTFGIERYTRSPSWQKNREYYRNGWADPTTGTNEFFNTGSFFFGPNSAPSGAALSAVTGAPFGFANGFGIFQINTDGTVAAGSFGNPGALGGVFNYHDPIDGQKVAYENFVGPTGAIIKGIKTNQVDDYFVTSPLNRWSMYGSAHYDFNDSLTAYVRGTFASTHTATNLFPTPFINGWTTNLNYNPVTDDPASPGFTPDGSAAAIAANAHPVTANLATLLNSRGLPLSPAGPTGPWTLWLIPTANVGGWIAPRSTVDDNNVWQMTAGLKGKTPVKDWTWELYGSHGQASDYTQGNGYTSLVRFETIMSSPDYGANQDFFGNKQAPNNGFGVAHVHCTSGFYGAIFHGTKPTQDCIDAITAQLQSRVLEEQNIVEFDTQGTLFALPAGDLKLSLGADYREEHVEYTPDILQSTRSFIDQVAGVYPTSYVNATTTAKEGYGELYVPVLKDLPLVKSFSLELGARYSTYTGADYTNGNRITPPGGWTYKILGDWRVTDWARLRGGYNLAVRSPNAGELFLAKQEVFAGSTAYGDPCTLRSIAPFGAGGAAVDPVSGATYGIAAGQTAAGALSAYNICKALMGPAGAAFYYGGNQLPQAASAPAPYGFENQIGQTGLKAEKGHTWTAGIVLSSPWHNPWTSNLRASVDWYSIKVNGAIEFQAVDQVKAGCYGQNAPDAATAAIVAASAACQLVSRIPGTGNEDVTTVQFSNLAIIRTSGIDLELDDAWNFEDIGLGGVPGRLQLNYLLTYLNYYDTQAFPGAPWVKWAGSLGPSLNGVQAGSAYKYKMNATLSYMEGPFSISLNWRYLPNTHSAQYPIVNQANCGKLFSCTLDTPAYHQFDLSGTWTIRRNYILRMGVDNLFNTQPPTTGATTGVGGSAPAGGNPYNYGTYTAGGSLANDGSGLTNPSLYDALGRRFYVGLKAKF